MAKLTIEDLLNSLENPDTSVKTLGNTIDTWTRIGNKDTFDELGLEPSELDSFLEDWRANNDYNNI